MARAERYCPVCYASDHATRAEHMRRESKTGGITLRVRLLADDEEGGVAATGG